MSGETLAVVCCVAALVVLISAGVASGVLPVKPESETFKERCSALGGRVIEKRLIRETLRLCVSTDGRLLE